MAEHGLIDIRGRKRAEADAAAVRTRRRCGRGGEADAAAKREPWEK
jgi:hypothetical protein